MFLRSLAKAEPKDAMGDTVSIFLLGFLFCPYLAINSTLMLRMGR